ncbi:uncharacterized protein LOC122303270 isoform X1 [Carya illinoinensis]|uniref:Uncharacterized protein n=1 Tax=Carya illinoinensis TaxID=32201 RepID=A0A922FJB9_CARIL|nr:uncharacterized protein LOC122303270 isoform X1 [Carya illinoinensis]KAG6721271.1 hypothetical protein I3842_03G104500 [Carya illinoinensis]
MRFKEREKRKKLIVAASLEHSSSEEELSLETVQAREPSTPSAETPKPEASFEHFTSMEPEVAYRTTFSRQPVLGEREKIDMFTAKWEDSQSKLEHQLATIRSDCVQENDRLVKLSLDMRHVMEKQENVIDFDAEE